MRKNNFTKERYKLTNRLNKENRKGYSNIHYYMNFDDIADPSKDELSYNIAKKIYDGQEIGLTFEEIIGGDYRDYCNSLIASRKKPPVKNKLKVFIRYESYVILLALIVNLLLQKPNINSILRKGVNLTGYGIMAVITGILYFGVTLVLLREASKYNKIISDVKDGMFITLIAIASLINTNIYIGFWIYILLVIIFVVLAVVISKKLRI